MRANASISLLSVGHACVDVYQGAVASLIPFFVAERDYGYAVASGLVLAASLLSSVVQPVFGVLTDRWAMPWLLPAGTLLGGAGIALSGVAGSYGLTLAFVAVSGIGVAAYHPESARLARLASRGRHSAMSWFSLGGTLGFALAPVLVSAVIGHGSLSRTPLLALPALAGAALCVPVVRALGGHRSGGHRSGGAPCGPSSAVGEDRAGTDVAGAVDDVGAFTRLALAVVFRSVVFVGLSTFVSLYARQRVPGGALAGTVALFVLFLGGAVGSLLGGFLADRYDRVRVSRWSYLLSVGAVAGVVCVPGPALFGFVALTSIGLYVPFSLQVTLAQDYLPSRVGTAAGVTLGLTVSVGGVVSPVLGRLADATSLRTALAPLIAMPVLSWLLLRTLPEPAAYRARPVEPAGRGPVRRV
ncbi:MFS transporter [Streptomyces sp. NPDC053493]|uniref:MFS transporter n=1 Tax=Streptomyces sp. NPDC053493 TaxID=3365705 RepID=UPI0037D713C0